MPQAKLRNPKASDRGFEGVSFLHEVPTKYVQRLHPLYPGGRPICISHRPGVAQVLGLGAFFPLAWDKQVGYPGFRTASCAGLFHLVLRSRRTSELGLSSKLLWGLCFLLIAGCPVPKFSQHPPSPVSARFYQEFANWLEAGLGHLPPVSGLQGTGPPARLS